MRGWGWEAIRYLELGRKWNHCQSCQTKFTIKTDRIWLHFGNCYMLGSTVASLASTQHNVPDSVRVPCTAFQIVLELDTLPVYNFHYCWLCYENIISAPQMLEWHTDCSSGSAASWNMPIKHQTSHINRSTLKESQPKTTSSLHLSCHDK